MTTRDISAADPQPSVPLPTELGGPRYIANREAVIWRAWDADECVVYHRLSGETHLLNAVTASVLRALEQRAMSVGELFDAIAVEFGSDDPEAYRTSLAQLLTHLDDLGLIQPVSRS